jgi:hypothetical protein
MALSDPMYFDFDRGLHYGCAAISANGATAVAVTGKITAIDRNIKRDA